MCREAGLLPVWLVPSLPVLPEELCLPAAGLLPDCPAAAAAAAAVAVAVAVVVAVDVDDDVAAALLLLLELLWLPPLLLFLLPSV